jgi:hypothetical protein
MTSSAGGAEQQQAFEEIKEYLSKPPVLVPPQQGKPFYVYLSVGDTSIAFGHRTSAGWQEESCFLSQQEDARCRDKVP